MVAGVVLAAVGLTGCGGDSGADPEAELAGIVREPLPVVDEAALPDVTHRGEPFVFRGDEDGLLLVYFGYTSCPDVCPTTMADLRIVLDELGDDADRISVAMATVDPDRDSEDSLVAYVESFVEDAHALRTDDDDQLRAAADAFGADYAVTVTDDGEIEVAHTGAVYAVDAEGSLLLQWPFGTPFEDIESDVRTLLAQSTPET